MTADQRLDQLEPLIAEAMTILDRHTAQLKQLSNAVVQNTTLLIQQSDNISFLLREHIVIKTDVATLKSDVAELKSDVAELKSDVAELKSDVAELKSDVAELKSNVAELKSDVVELKSDVAELKSDVTTIKSDMAEMKQMQIGFDSKLDLILSKLN